LEVVGVQVDGGEVGVADLDAFGVVAVVEAGVDGEDGLVVVAAIRLMMTSWLTSGLPRRLMLMKLNIRCSMLCVPRTRRRLDVEGRTNGCGAVPEMEEPG
jgi:hypothetical protein